MRQERNLPKRQRPHRLPAEAYREPWQPVCFSICTARRGALLTRNGIPELLVDAMDHNASDHACALIAYCIMPDHLHLVACVVREGGDLRGFVGGLKRRTATTLRSAGTEPPIWERSYWDRHVRSDEDLSATIEYILANPVRKGLCDRPEDWPYAEFRGYPWA
jgi:putative transposase